MTRRTLILLMCCIVAALVVMVSNILWTFHAIPAWLAAPLDTIAVLVMGYTCYVSYKDGIAQIEESRRRYDRLRELERQFKENYDIDLDLTTGLKRS